MAVDTPTEAIPARVRDDDESSVEEIVRPNIQVVPQGMLKIQPPPMIMNKAPFRMIWGFGLLAICDLAMHAGAGAATASVGAKHNGFPVTTRALQIGALAGVTKAGMTTFREIMLMAEVNLVFSVLIFLLSSSFGICPLLVTEIGNLTLGETPKELVIAGVVAAVPLFFDTIRDIQPKPDEEGNTKYFRWVYAIFLIASDALGGYVFARMASNQGMPISNYSAACSAGAAFGTISFLSRAVTGCIAMIEFTSNGRVSNIFGVYEVVVPEPVYMTQDEYTKMQEGILRFFTGFFGETPKLAVRPLKFMACCLPCCCPCWGRKLGKEMKEAAKEFEQMELEMGMHSEGMAEGMAMFGQMMIGRVVPDDDETIAVTNGLRPPQATHAIGM